MTQSSTATTAGARQHARAQEAAAASAVLERPQVPAGTHPPADLPDGTGPEQVVWHERIAPGGYSHRRLAAGTRIRLTDVVGDACAHLLLFNADAPWERLNVADTVKVQWQAYLGPGQLLLSDQARVLATITEDTSRRHDTIYGTSTRARNTERYGDGSPHGPSPAGRELFVLGGVKHGLGRRDLPPSVSLFQGVRIDDEGRPRWQGSAGAGASVTLTAQLDVVILLANVPHPLDPRPDYTCGALDVAAWTGAPLQRTDPLWDATPEGRRAFDNTDDYARGRGTRR